MLLRINAWPRLRQRHHLQPKLTEPEDKRARIWTMLRRIPRATVRRSGADMFVLMTILLFP